MTLSQAEQIHDMVETLRANEERFKCLTERYDSISGYYNEGPNSMPFNWDLDSPEYDAIVNMVDRQITDIRAILKNIEVRGI